MLFQISVPLKESASGLLSKTPKSAPAKTSLPANLQKWVTWVVLLPRLLHFQLEQKKTFGLNAGYKRLPNVRHARDQKVQEAK